MIAALTITFGAIWIPIAITLPLAIWGLRPVQNDTFGIGGAMKAGAALILALIVWVVYLAIT